MSEYISVTDTARLIRKDLKAEFPGVKFSVRSKSYSGGSSIRIEWRDGPTEEQVKPIQWRYQGGGFDGMIDMAYSHYHYRLPDGSIEYAGTPGSGNSGGMDEPVDNPPPPGAVKVHFGANFVFLHRYYSRELVNMVIEKLALEYGRVPEVAESVFWFSDKKQIPCFHFKPEPIGHDNLDHWFDKALKEAKGVA